MSTKIFEGRDRLRVPALHLLIAIEGGVSLREALAGHIFAMLHDKLTHTCLIRDAQAELKGAGSSDIQNARTPDDAALVGVFSMMADFNLAGEEWSYLSAEEALDFYLLADTMVEQVQRWICEGKQKPYTIPLGPLVERPDWAKVEHPRDSSEIGKSRQIVQKYQSEIVRQ